MKPRKRLSFDLNLVDLTETGFWLCLSCQLITEPLTFDTDGGLAHCLHCNSTRLKYNPPLFPPGEVKNPVPKTV